MIHARWSDHERVEFPQVLKCDNGPAFLSHAMKDFLCGRAVVAAAFSPPHAPWYNGAIEKANRSLKEIAEHQAGKDGHAGYCTSSDLYGARLQVEPTDSTVGTRWIDS